MSYTVKVTPMDGYCCAKIEGVWPQKDSQAQASLLARILAEWKSDSQPGLIIDVRSMQDTPSVLEDYETAKIFFDSEFYRIGPVAVLDHPERKSANVFLENAAHNRGIMLRFFYDGRQEAIDWISTQQ